MKAMMASINAVVDTVQGDKKASVPTAPRKPRISTALLSMAAFVKIVVLSIDVGLRKPGLCVTEIWWDPEFDRPRCHIRHVTADSVVPDSVRDVRNLKTERHVELIKKYIHVRNKDFFPPDLTHIFIERQHSKGSRIMGHMSYVLYAWLPEAYAKYHGGRKKQPEVMMVSAKLKTKHFSRKETNTRPKRKRIVYKDMLEYIPDQGPEMTALFNAKIKGNDAKFDMCDCVAQAVAWFTYNVKRPDGKAPRVVVDSDSEFSDEEEEDGLPRVKTRGPPRAAPFVFNSKGDIV